MASKSVISSEENQEVIQNNPEPMPTEDAKPIRNRSKSSSSATYARPENRTRRVIRIAQVPGKIGLFSIYEVMENHEVKPRNVSYADALKISKKTGIQINHS